MTSNKSTYPSLAARLYSVWYRHFRVYTQNLLSNGLPPFLEPLLFLTGVGLGLSKYVTESMDGLRYIEFLGTGLLMTSAMFTVAFECTYGTFIRLEFGKIYDGMLAAPLTVKNLVLGEIIWVGTKGLFILIFSWLAVLRFGKRLVD
jgi:lipooligosaccharide transport system permease protein